MRVRQGLFQNRCRPGLWRIQFALFILVKPKFRCILCRINQIKKAVDTCPLGERAMTVLGHLGKERKNKEIALTLGLSKGTGKMHVMSICRKLEATNRTQAVL